METNSLKNLKRIAPYIAILLTVILLFASCNITQTPGNTPEGQNPGQEQSSSWKQSTRIIAEDGVASAYFGNAVSLSTDGKTALIGSFVKAGGLAYVYSYDGTTWSKDAKLAPKDGLEGDQFGASVSLSSDGRIALIGAPKDDDKGNASGSAYVYVLEGATWSQQTKLIAEDGIASDQFGISVSLSADGGTALIGATLDDDEGTDSGSVYVYNYSGTTWVKQTKLTAEDGETGDQFGKSVSLSSNGQTALVGSILDDDNSSNSGSAYVYNYNGTTWVKQAKLIASDGTDKDRFGYSVSLSSDGLNALIGAYGDGDNGTDSGSAYVYNYSEGTWTEKAKLIATYGAADDNFGYAVSLSPDGLSALVGAWQDDDKGKNSGSAYSYVFQ